MVPKIIPGKNVIIKPVSYIPSTIYAKNVEC